MGIDFVGWKNCQLQEQLGEDGFLDAMKLAALRATAEQQFGPNLAGRVFKLPSAAGGARQLSYEQVVAELGDLAAAAPECADCLNSAGRKRGSYHYVSYPLDEPFERLLFAYFAEQVADRKSPCGQIYEAVIADLPRAGTPWHDLRGPTASPRLAELPEPLRHDSGTPGLGYLDSAQIMAALFRSVEDTGQLSAYSLFWSGFAEYGRRQQPPAQSKTLIETGGLEHLYQLAALDSMTTGGEVLVFW